MVVNRMGRDWVWPDYDTQLIRVFDYVRDLDTALKVSGRQTAVQAGGAAGLWPWYLSQYFRDVITFEPEPRNFECLIQNAPDVEAHMAALGAVEGEAGIRIGEHENAGTWHIAGAGSVRVMTIDSLSLRDCDLIVLDVEGGELRALKGAAETIERLHPVIMLEEKQLAHMKHDAAAARNFLCSTFGYREYARVHRDVILC